MRKTFAAFILPLILFIGIDSANHLLDENIRVTILDTDNEGNTIFRRWIRSATENPGIVSADEYPLSTVGSTEEEQITGDGEPISFSDKGYTIRGKNPEDKDYIDSGIKIKAKKCRSKIPVKAIVETLVICDKEWANVFKYDYDKIVNYWVAFFWDVNLRFKTLPSSDISFQVNDIIVIANKSAQPFIENARSANGYANFTVILTLFQFWVYEQREKLPLHDVAALAVNAVPLTQATGATQTNGACLIKNENKTTLSAVTFKDGGEFEGVFTAAHEMGHNLGADHDFEDDLCEKENQRGFIMGGTADKTPELEFFFSNCSDRMTNNFLRLANNKPKLDPSFDNATYPSIEEQIKIWIKNKGFGKNISIDENKDTPCKQKTIYDLDKNIGYDFTPLDNSDCSNGGKCFRGACRQPAQLFKNVGNGLCIQASNPFTNSAPFLMVECPSSRGTALDKLFVKEGKSGSMLLSSFIKLREVGERCAYVGDAEGDTIKTDRCDTDNKMQGWFFQNIGKTNQFLLTHIATKRCAKPETNSVGSLVGTYKACDSNDKNMKWEKY